MRRLFLLIILLFAITTQTLASDHRVHTRKLDSNQGLPLHFYYAPFCRPVKRSIVPIESIGQALMGDQIEPFFLNFDLEKLETINCKVIKESELVTCPATQKGDIAKLRELVEKDYDIQILIDNLPVGSKSYKEFQCGDLPKLPLPNLDRYTKPNGFSIGCKDGINSNMYLNNHWNFVLSYHETKNGKRYLVGAEVIPSSLDHSSHEVRCGPRTPLIYGSSQPLLNINDLELNKPITFSYSLTWKKSDIVWASRWDAYINSEQTLDSKTHLLSIVNLFVLVLVLSSLIASLLYYRIGKELKSTEITNWKSIRYDVFAPPRAPSVLAAFFGSGVQLLGMLIITLGLGIVVFTSPGNRGKYGTLMLLFYGLMGISSGYYSMRMYKLMGGVHWKLTTILQAFAFPAIMFFLYCIVNLIVRLSTSSSTYLNVLSLLKIFCMWVFISMPLVFIGAYFGFKKKKITIPFDDESVLFDVTRSTTEPWYSRWYILNLIGGGATFLSLLTDIFPVMTGIWLRKYYHVVGFLFIAVVISLIASAEFAMAITYYQLVHRNPHWWWRAFITCGSSALYFIVYFVYFYFNILNIDNAGFALVFFQYMSMATFVFFLLTGTMGLLGSFWFVRSLYFKLEEAMESNKI